MWASPGWRGGSSTGDKACHRASWVEACSTPLPWVPAGGRVPTSRPLQTASEDSVDCRPWRWLHSPSRMVCAAAGACRLFSDSGFPGPQVRVRGSWRRTGLLCPFGPHCELPDGPRPRGCGEAPWPGPGTRRGGARGPGPPPPGSVVGARGCERALLPGVPGAGSERSASELDPHPCNPARGEHRPRPPTPALAADSRWVRGGPRGGRRRVVAQVQPRSRGNRGRRALGEAGLAHVLLG